jgi:hypothetical protein
MNQIISLNDQRLIKFFLLFPILFLVTCSSSKKQPEEVILAQVGDKTISVKEFIYRAELTLRPNNFKDKDVTLSNLISEKILALEAGPHSESLKNTAFQSHLKGIKEQTMRDKLFKEMAYERVKLDSQEIANKYRLSKREYELEFYTIHDRKIAQTIDAALDSAPELSDRVFEELQNQVGKKPTHKVKYLDPDDEVIQKALYTNLLDVGETIGPLRLSNGDYLMMKVVNWSDVAVIGGEERQIRWNQVAEKLHLAKAEALWQAYQVELMKGKKLLFNKSSFETLSSAALQHYLKKSPVDTAQAGFPEIPFEETGIDLNAPFFTVGKQVWTVADFKQAVMSHPLVFDTKYLTPENFSRHFKRAVVDVIRDHYLTAEAYRRSLDDSEDIKRTLDMWSDAFVAYDQKKKVVNTALEQGLVKKGDELGIHDYWEKYIQDLQQKYSDSIRLNYNEFDQIKLTKVDFYAIRPGVPYPVGFPSFPLLSASATIDYIKQKL